MDDCSKGQGRVKIGTIWHIGLHHFCAEKTESSQISHHGRAIQNVHASECQSASLSWRFNSELRGPAWYWRSLATLETGVGSRCLVGSRDLTSCSKCSLNSIWPMSSAAWLWDAQTPATMECPLTSSFCSFYEVRKFRIIETAKRRKQKTCSLCELHWKWCWNPTLKSRAKSCRCM